MVPDIDYGLLFLFLIGGGLVIPFSVPVVTGGFVGWFVPKRDWFWGAFWAAPLGLINIPLSYVAFRFGQDAWEALGPWWLPYAWWVPWALWVVASAALTALALKGFAHLIRERETEEIS